MQQRNKVILAKTVFIQRVLAGFFLLLFAFGNTPRLTLHNLVANHKDTRTRQYNINSQGTQLGNAGINCQCDHLVMESPFVEAGEKPVQALLFFYPSFQPGYTEVMPAASMPVFFLRGPPAC